MLSLRKVSVWPWHLELGRMPPEHGAHGEHGGCGLRGGDEVGRSLAERGRDDRLDARADAGLLDGSRQRDPLSVNKQVATCGAATPRSCCSTASAAG